ncbi:hypothetical protein A2954_04675 [Candidatus Roizmanbacteria bacterium RIFCSPLOWO2_01_FULL_37_12]|uniref:Cohesin domain-containing protein n=1 Tax=Candidatus Roizmanbacteria bacterium RIFCSPLOWO2_01_FULL_37_12 TaxID=1802056 RepID=A0A1F7IG07_9BACT|nr:MAG: hypothetical protein A3D76_06115 [Candidatus Roizmanbacteria bacterium RIFCSPHIGHO2_02_FULL_37_9b]OGK42276.1 MAG: hypothetical protein A2954_04675 [Candidatus Roizmanbacteria bacterium RIFCSPLOWO2_01_FULL_37_12]
MVELANKDKKNPVTRFILLIVVVAFAILLVILNQSKKKTEIKEAPARAIPTPVVLTEGSLSLRLGQTDQKVNQNKTIKLEVVADSNKKSIVGYDIVIKYERGAVEVLSVESLQADFEVYPLEKSDHFIITGAKKIESKRTFIFENTPILRLNIIPKKTGELTLNLVDVLGLEKSQMVDEETNILVPQVGEFKLKN